MSITCSVVITTCDRREDLLRAVQSALRQSVAPQEIIVVDDCSGFDLERELSVFDNGRVPVRSLVLPKRSGAPVARNTGAAMAAGEILMFLDDDDQWTPTKIERQIALFEAHPEAGWIYTGMAAVNRVSEEIVSFSRRHESGRVWPQILFRNFVGPTSGVAIRRRIFEQIGGFDPELPALQDYDLWLRLAMAAPVIYDGGHELLFTSQPSSQAARISTKTESYQRAYASLNAKYQGELASLSATERRRFRANACLVLMGKFLHARRIREAIVMLARAVLAEPRIFSRIAASFHARLRGPSKSPWITRTLSSSPGREITFSVIVPVYNRAHCIGAALASVLAQELAPLEIIVVDDGSEDDLGAALAPFANSVTLIRSPVNQGAAAARNMAIAAARGTHVAFLDSDDTWSSGKLRAQHQLMSSSGLDLCCTGFSVAGAPMDRAYGETISLVDLVWGCYVSPGTTLAASREILRRIGGYDTAFRRLEDWDLLLRLIRAGHPIGFLPAVLANVAKSPGATSDAVFAGLTRMRQRHLEPLRSLSTALARRFRAALAFEAAGVHAKSGRWGAMVVALGRSFALAPLGNRSFRLILAPKLTSRLCKLHRGARHA